MHPVVLRPRGSQGQTPSEQRSSIGRSQSATTRAVQPVYTGCLSLRGLELHDRWPFGSCHHSMRELVRLWSVHSHDLVVSYLCQQLVSEFAAAVVAPGCGVERFGVCDLSHDLEQRPQTDRRGWRGPERALRLPEFASSGSHDSHGSGIVGTVKRWFVVARRGPC